MDSDEYESSNSRRSSLAISALLNDDSVDPIIPSRKLTPDEKRENRKTWHGFVTEDAPKAKRKRISTQQFNRLMEIFQQTDTPSSEVRENLAEELDMTKREVQVWFQNRRAKASRARVAAASMSNPNNGPIKYDTYSWSDHQHQPINPSRLHPMPIQQQQPVLQYPPQYPRRASFAYPDGSSITPTTTPHRPASTLQPIAPMPPPSVPRRPASITAMPSSSVTPPYNQSTPPTPPYVQSIAPRKHSIHQGFENLSLRTSTDDGRPPAKKRPKSVIELFKTTL